MPKKIVSDLRTSVNIKVFGVGGSGGNAVNYIIKRGIDGIDGDIGFIVANTDAQDLHKSLAGIKINLGKNITGGRGTGMDPDLGRQAAEESKAAIQEALEGTEMLFLACGMGGGTGTGAAPVIAEIAREMGILTVAVVTRPFTFEGDERMRIAEAGIDRLRGEVDSLIVIPNDRLLQLGDEQNLSFTEAFAKCDDVLYQAIRGISDLISRTGVLNTDFADVRAMLTNAGTAYIGIGVAGGEDRATKAAEAAVNSSLLEVSINGAQRILFSVVGDLDNLLMTEVHSIADYIITKHADPNAKVIFGANQAKDIDGLGKDEIKVTVIATGFGSSNKSQSQKNKAAGDEGIIDESNSDTDDFFGDLDIDSDDEVSADTSGGFPAFFGGKK